MAWVAANPDIPGQRRSVNLWLRAEWVRSVSVNRLGMRAIVLLGAALLSGCTVLGPDFQRPQVPWLDGWKGGSLESLAADPRVPRSLNPAGSAGLLGFPRARRVLLGSNTRSG